MTDPQLIGGLQLMGRSLESMSRQLGRYLELYEYDLLTRMPALDDSQADRREKLARKLWPQRAE